MQFTGLRSLQDIMPLTEANETTDGELDANVLFLTFLSNHYGFRSTTDFALQSH